MDTVVGVNCTVDIYPYEVGSTSGQPEAYTFSSTDKTYGMQLINVSTRKNIYDANGGQFTINIVPGGPNGIEDVTTWTQIITPLSLVVISMQRGDAFGLPMIGVVHQVSEGQYWNNERVYRTLKISGFDFTYFFSQFSYWNNLFLGAAPVNQITSFTSTSAISGTPAQIGLAWYQNIFLKILGAVTFNASGNGNVSISAPSSETSVSIPAGTNAWNYAQTTGNVTAPSFTPVNLSDIFGYVFNETVYSSNNYTIPFNSNLLTSEGTWYDKFKDFFQFPFYEFFVHVFPVENQLEFMTQQGTLVSDPLVTFSLNNIEFGIYVVGRLNPFPYLKLLEVPNNFTTLTYTSDTSVYTVGMDLWNGLLNYTPDSVLDYTTNEMTPLSDYDPSTMFSSEISFNLDEYYNFYLFNSTAFQTFNSAQFPNMPQYMNWPFIVDDFSIARYGWRPLPYTTTWYSNVFQDTAESYEADIGQFISILSSYYTPKPMMGNTIYSGPLRPDILPGQTFTYNPFKDTSNFDPSLQSNLWTFYIEEVAHDFNFGGKSATSLKLTRGLPTKIYNQEDGRNLLQGVLSGTVHRYYNDFNGVAYGAYGPVQNIPPNLPNAPGTYILQTVVRGTQNINNIFYSPFKKAQ